MNKTFAEFLKSGELFDDKTRKNWVYDIIKLAIAEIKREEEKNSMLLSVRKLQLSIS